MCNRSGFFLKRTGCWASFPAMDGVTGASRHHWPDAATSQGTSRYRPANATAICRAGVSQEYCCTDNSEGCCELDSEVCPAECSTCPRSLLRSRPLPVLLKQSRVERLVQMALLYAGLAFAAVAGASTLRDSITVRSSV
jgi:hypothetical protein